MGDKACDVCGGPARLAIYSPEWSRVIVVCEAHRPRSQDDIVRLAQERGGAADTGRRERLSDRG